MLKIGNMKKNLLLIVCFLFIGINAYTQSGFIGTWEGMISIGGNSLRVVFHIKNANNGLLSGEMDSPDQGVKGINCSAVTELGDSLFIEMDKMGAYYAGKMQDASHIAGVLKQAGYVLPMNLKKGIETAGPNRPQTPKPPFDYISEDVIYQNADKTQQFGATITIPKGWSGATYPALVLITGSGLQNRDEEISGHKPFAVIADYLTKKGYIVLRVDDRSMGQSTGDVKNATTADFAKDVSTSFDYLKLRKEVDTKKMGLLGHSEGGIIAPMLASERKDVDFIILMAGVGEKVIKLMGEQNVAVLESNGVRKDYVEKYSPLYNEFLQIVMKSEDKADAITKMTQAVDKWKAKNTADVVIGTTGIQDEQSEQAFVAQFATQAASAWFKYFLSCDPDVYLRKLSCKVLAIDGSKDIQVIPGPNLAAIKASLAKSRSKVYEVKELPELNHLFQTCAKCTVDEYGELEETISPLALQTIGYWLDKNVK